MTPPRAKEQAAVPEFIRKGECQTKNGCPVVIYTTEAINPRLPVVGAIINDGEKVRVRQWNAQGGWLANQASGYDLIPAESGPRAGEALPITLDEIDRIAEEDLGGWPNDEALSYGRELVVAFVRRGWRPPESWTPPRPAGGVTISGARDMDKRTLGLLAGVATSYTGHVPCRKCGTVHWMHGPCPDPGKPTFTEEDKARMNARSEEIAKEFIAQPPASAAREWDALVLMCKDAIRCARDNGSYTAELDVTECQKLLDAIASAHSVAPPPALPAVPEGVPPLEGEFTDFDYFGRGPIENDGEDGHPDIACFCCGSWSTMWAGSINLPTAIRRGTKLHADNFPQ